MPGQCCQLTAALWLCAGVQSHCCPQSDSPAAQVGWTTSGFLNLDVAQCSCSGNGCWYPFRQSRTQAACRPQRSCVCAITVRDEDPARLTLLVSSLQRDRHCQRHGGRRRLGRRSGAASRSHCGHRDRQPGVPADRCLLAGYVASSRRVLVGAHSASQIVLCTADLVWPWSRHAADTIILSSSSLPDSEN